MDFSDQIRSILSAKAEALVKPSPDALLELLDPLFVYVNSKGDRFDKRLYVDSYCGSGKIKFRSQRLENLEVRDFGSFAVATMIVHDHFEYSGALVTGVFRSLCVFSRVGSRWLWAAGQTMSVGTGDGA